MVKLSMSGRTQLTVVNTMNSMATNCIYETEFSYTVKSGKSGFTIPGGQARDVKYRVRSWQKGGVMLFEPCVMSHEPEGLYLYTAGKSKCMKI